MRVGEISEPTVEELQERIQELESELEDLWTKLKECSECYQATRKREEHSKRAVKYLCGYLSNIHKNDQEGDLCKICPMHDKNCNNRLMYNCEDISEWERFALEETENEGGNDDEQIL